jgi:hypothetical protein
MEEQIAEFLAEIRVVRALDGVDHLVAFFDEKRSQA